MASRKWRPQMTRGERRRGWVFFFLYLLVLPWLNGLAQRLLFPDGEIPAAEAGVVYYLLLTLLALLFFWSFLRHGLSLLLDWLPENAFAFLTGLLGGAVLGFLASLLPLPVEDPIPLQYAAEYAIAPAATAVLVILLMPLVEETLFRGLVFGTFRQYGRLSGYLAAVFLYAFACVWRYALDLGDLSYLLLAIRYLPMSLALTWCYDNGGSIWGAVALHAAFNALTLFKALG